MAKRLSRRVVTIGGGTGFQDVGGYVSDVVSRGVTDYGLALAAVDGSRSWARFAASE